VRYDGLYADYWNKQIARVEELRQKIAARGSTPAGRLFPDLDDLAIGTGRRLDATIMFTDICNFTTRSSGSAEEQEMLLRVLNLYFTEMIKIISEYGGTVEKNTGDGLMAYFENQAAGTAGENSTQRALACALTMQAANSNLINPVLRASGVAPIQYRTTMEYGPVTIARMGPPRLFNAMTAIGNAANFASKMLRWVGADQIGLGHAACMRLPASWRTTQAPLAPVATGWTYGTPPQPYPIYYYTGRWNTVL
jgi:adenylate cyclase